MSIGFLLDTNVLSELMRSHPAQSVKNWFANHVQSTMYTSAITQAEILTGIALLPFGKRRTELAIAAEQMFEQEFYNHCLDFDSVSAKHYAVLVGTRCQQGLPISTEDAQIAAIALKADLSLVTRNTKDFDGIEGLNVVNPWHVEASHRL